MPNDTSIVFSHIPKSQLVEQQAEELGQPKSSVKTFFFDLETVVQK